MPHRPSRLCLKRGLKAESEAGGEAEAGLGWERPPARLQSVPLSSKLGYLFGSVLEQELFGFWISSRGGGYRYDFEVFVREEKGKRMKIGE